MFEESHKSAALLERASAGDAAAWGALLVKHQVRLQRMVAFRLDSRLRRRVDASDVVQEGFPRGGDPRWGLLPHPADPCFPVAARHRAQQAFGGPPPPPGYRDAR